MEIKGSKTVQQFYDEMLEKYGIDIDILLANGETIASSLDEESLEINRNRKIEEIYLSMGKIKPKEKKEKVSWKETKKVSTPAI